MSTTYDRLPFMDFQQNLAALRHKWGWFVALGVVLIVVGAIALGALVEATLATAIAIGALLLVGGIAEVIGAFWSRGWSGFFFHLLAGVLSVVVGVLFLWTPVGAVLTLTLLMACLFIVAGIFKVVVAASYRHEGWGWPLASGILDVLLGLLIAWGWPTTALWVLGMFLGISFIFRGVNWIALGLLIRNSGRRDSRTEAAPTA